MKEQADARRARRTNDFYKQVVEQKEAHKADASLKKGLKCIGNAGAYGPLVELNEQREGEDVKLNIYSGEHYHQQTIREREVPGPFYFPPLASLITAGGRLLLALAEKCVADAGGTYLFCDTDSCASLRMRRVDSHAEEHAQTSAMWRGRISANSPQSRACHAIK